MHKKFEQASFDVIASHAGLHGHELAGVENILWLLKPHGLAVISVEDKQVEIRNAINSRVHGITPSIVHNSLRYLETFAFTKIPPK